MQEWVYLTVSLTTALVLAFCIISGLHALGGGLVTWWRRRRPR